MARSGGIVTRLETDGSLWTIVNDGTADPGTFVTCEVTEAHPYDLVARIVPAGPHPGEGRDPGPRPQSSPGRGRP